MGEREELFFNSLGKGRDFLPISLLNDHPDFFRKVRTILKIVKTKTLKRLTIIVTNLTKSYFVISKITEFTKSKNNLNKTTKSRVLSQVNKIFANLFKCRKFQFSKQKKQKQQQFSFF